MVRAWLRPPANCFHRAAVPLPAIVIRVVSVATRRRKNQTICACIDVCDGLNGGEQERGHETFEPKQGVEAIKFEDEPESVKCIGKQRGQGEQATGKTCRWHSSLDTTDRLLFLIMLFFVLFCVITIIIVLPCKQGYY